MKIKIVLSVWPDLSLEFWYENFDPEQFGPLGQNI